MNEPELIINIQNGDSDSFKKLFELYKDKAARTFSNGFYFRAMSLRKKSSRK